jgi:ankyrin repeat protein
VALDAGYRTQVKQMFDNRGMAFPETSIRVGELILFIRGVNGLKKKESVQKARDLIEAHPELATQCDHYQRTPLHAAAFHGAVELIPLLIEKGAGVNAVDQNGETPIHCVHNAAAARRLVDAGADVNLPDRRGYPPLNRAASRNQIELARVLLEGGADPDAVDSQGQTAVDIAKTMRHESLAKILLKYKKEKQKSKPI